MGINKKAETLQKITELEDNKRNHRTKHMEKNTFTLKRKRAPVSCGTTLRGLRHTLLESVKDYGAGAQKKVFAETREKYFPKFDKNYK